VVSTLASIKRKNRFQSVPFIELNLFRYDGGFLFLIGIEVGGCTS
jgi:hypothetical protein